MDNIAKIRTREYKVFVTFDCVNTNVVRTILTHYVIIATCQQCGKHNQYR